MTIIVNEALSLRSQNYGQLKALITKRLGRTNLGDVIPDFVALAESRFYTGSRDLDVTVPPLRINAMLATEAESLASLPAGFLSLERLLVNDGAGLRPLTYVTPERFAELAPTGFARYYTFQDGGIAVEGGQPASCAATVRSSSSSSSSQYSAPSHLHNVASFPSADGFLLGKVARVLVARKSPGTATSST